MYLKIKDSSPHCLFFITSFHNTDLHVKVNTNHHRYRDFVNKCLLFNKCSFYDNVMIESVNN